MYADVLLRTILPKSHLTTATLICHKYTFAITKLAATSYYAALLGQ
jgi:hypothetical protein